MRCSAAQARSSQLLQVAAVPGEKALASLCCAAPALFSLHTSTLLVCWSSRLTRCDLTPPASHTGGKRPSCLTTSMFMDPSLPLPGGPGSHTLFYFLLRAEGEKKKTRTVLTSKSRRSFHRSARCVFIAELRCTDLTWESPAPLPGLLTFSSYRRLKKLRRGRSNEWTDRMGRRWA